MSKKAFEKTAEGLTDDLKIGRGEADLFEMVNLAPAETGLPMTIFASRSCPA